MNKIDKAYEAAYEAHKMQLDDSGRPYFTAHILQVVDIIKCVTNDEDVICAAYLHDIIEDTYFEYEDIKEEFGTRVADLVNEVTHEGQKDEYGYYFPRLHSKDGIMIKLADRLSNISRMEAWSEERKAHYLKRTQFWKDGSDRQKERGGES